MAEVLTRGKPLTSKQFDKLERLITDVLRAFERRFTLGGMSEGERVAGVAELSELLGALKMHRQAITEGGGHEAR